LEGAAELASGDEAELVYDGATELTGGTTYPLEEPTELGMADETRKEVPVASVAVVSEGIMMTLLEPVGVTPEVMVMTAGADAVLEDVTTTGPALDEEAPYSLEAGTLEVEGAIGPEGLGKFGIVIDGVSYAPEEGTKVVRTLVWDGMPPLGYSELPGVMEEPVMTLTETIAESVE